MPDIVISEFMDEAAVADLKRDFSVHYDKDLVDKPDELRELTRDARALIVRNRTKVDRDLLAAATILEAVGRLGVGLDNIDLPQCAARNIAVLPATGANDIAVAEWVITTIMMLLRGAYLATAEVTAGHWPRTRLIGHEAYGKTLGLIGFGAIARETAKRARPLGLKLLACDPFVASNDASWSTLGVERVDIDRLLASSDAVSLHIPLPLKRAI